MYNIDIQYFYTCTPFEIIKNDDISLVVQYILVAYLFYT